VALKTGWSNRGTLDIQKQLMSIERVAETLRRWEDNFWPLLVEALGHEGLLNSRNLLVAI
jgi:hypothetical protein